MAVGVSERNKLCEEIEMISSLTENDIVNVQNVHRMVLVPWFFVVILSPKDFK